VLFLSGGGWKEGVKNDEKIKEKRNRRVIRTLLRIRAKKIQTSEERKYEGSLPTKGIAFECLLTFSTRKMSRVWQNATGAAMRDSPSGTIGKLGH
jgi:hypothetical protein